MTDLATIHLDHLYFVPDFYGNEVAYLPDGDMRGEIHFDEIWQAHEARKLIGDKPSPWQQMRCLAEARAFIVSRKHTWFNSTAFARRKAPRLEDVAI